MDPGYRISDPPVGYTTEWDSTDAFDDLNNGNEVVWTDLGATGDVIVQPQFGTRRIRARYTGYTGTNSEWAVLSI